MHMHVTAVRLRNKVKRLAHVLVGTAMAELEGTVDMCTRLGAYWHCPVTHFSHA